jgi:hypothetical protein
MNLNTRGVAAPMIAAIWIGLILGVSFYAASIKFTAAGVSTEQLLAVGKVTFQGFKWIELAAFVLLLVATLNRFTRGVVIWIVVLGLLLFVQKFVVMPVLDTALDRAVAGEAMEEDSLHFIYGAIDCAKIVVLFLLVFMLRAGGDAGQVPDAQT